MARFDLSQEQRLGARQEQQLLPRMIVSIEVLQLPTADLDVYLCQAAEENVALALEGPAPEWSPATVEPSRSPARAAADADRFRSWLENQPAPSRGASELLLEEVRSSELESELGPWVELLIQSLDEDGRLPGSDEELLALAASLGLPADRSLLGRATAAVQKLEPRGLGGRTLEETLLLQLDPGDPDYGDLCRLIEGHLDEIARNKLPAVARALGIGMERLESLLALLRALDPAPARRLAQRNQPPVHPDLVVERGASGFEVRLVRSRLPSLGIDEEIALLARDPLQPTPVRRYLRERVEKARWLVDALEERGKTLLRVASLAFAYQRAFLERGPGHLVPLRMNRIADELSLSLSTVSRAVAGKYVETPYGVDALRRFFQAPAGGSGGAGEAAREDARELVRREIESEDPLAPLSDDDVAERLARGGLRLARRTVAKYRSELGIPSSYRRKRHT